MATNLSSAAVLVFEPQNTQAIIQMGPVAVTENQVSRDRCVAYGQNLISEIQSKGMTDELDQKAAQYIANSKKTITKMRDKRTPLTKIFDEIRAVFTAFENDVDPARVGTIPFQVQQLRNQYATRKRAEAEAAARAEALRIARENALSKYALDVEDDFKRQLNGLINEKINELNAIDASTTLENYDMQFSSLKTFNANLSEQWLCNLKASSYVRRQPEITTEECAAIQARIIKDNMSNWSSQYRFEIESTRDDIIDRFPSKKKQLQKAAEASAEEAARIKAEMAAREAEEARRREQERQRKEQEERAKKELASQKAEINSLFDSASVASAEYSPKTSVKRKLIPLSAEAFLPIVSMWWSKEGQHLPVDELSKIFKKQLAFCEKLANDKDSPEEIVSDYIDYQDEVKAK